MMVEGDVSSWKPICVASTPDGVQTSGFDTATSVNTNKEHSGDNYFKGAEWLVLRDPLT